MSEQRQSSAEGRAAGSGSLLTRVIEAWCDIEGMSWLDLLDTQDFSPDEIALVRCIATGEGCDSVSAPEATPDVPGLLAAMRRDSASPVVVDARWQASQYATSLANVAAVCFYNVSGQAVIIPWAQAGWVLDHWSKHYSSGAVASVVAPTESR